MRGLALACPILWLTVACTQPHSDLPNPRDIPPPITYAGEWGKRGGATGQFSDPTDITVDTVGNVYISDPGNKCVHKFDPHGTLLLSLRHSRMKHPAGIALDEKDTLYVADSESSGVFVFTSGGTMSREIHTTAGDPLRGPESVAVGTDGSIYIFEAKASRVRKIDYGGKTLTTWGKEGPGQGEFRRPNRIANGPDGSIYVSDGGNRRMQKFRPDGKFVAAWGVGGSLADLGRLACLAVSRDYVFAITPDRHVVNLWSLDGRDLYFNLLEGRLTIDQGQTFCLAVSPRDELLVLDWARMKVLRYHIDYDALRKEIRIFKIPFAQLK